VRECGKKIFEVSDFQIFSKYLKNLIEKKFSKKKFSKFIFYFSKIGLNARKKKILKFFSLSNTLNKI
jgi:hypothetical protein